jgi:hypothetical protein
VTLFEYGSKNACGETHAIIFTVNNIGTPNNTGNRRISDDRNLLTAGLPLPRLTAKSSGAKPGVATKYAGPQRILRQNLFP